MDTHIILTGPDWTEIGMSSDYALECAVGDDENDFDLKLRGMHPPRLGEGSLWYVEGTEWGGIVDRVKVEHAGGASAVTYSGRAWPGILQGRVVLPASGQTHYRSQGDANRCIGEVIAALGLQGLFVTPAGDSGIEVDHQWDRFDDAWHGLVSALASAGARPEIRRVDGYTMISAVPAATWGDEVDSDLIDFTMERDYRPVNHLVCAGSGEMEDRAVVHLYASESGEVSRVQTLFGTDEVAELYEYTTDDEDELIEDGTKKLLDYQVQGEIDVSIPDGSTEFSYGDTVVGRDNESGIVLTGKVSRKTATGSGGPMTISYEIGEPSAMTAGRKASG